MNREPRLEVMVVQLLVVWTTVCTTARAVPAQHVAAPSEAPFSEASCVRPAPYIHDLIQFPPTVWESPQEETGSWVRPLARIPPAGSPSLVRSLLDGNSFRQRSE